MMRSVRFAVLALAFAACAGAAAADPVGAWRLAAIDGAPTPESSHATLRLDKTRASGSAGCNAFGADVAQVADELVFSHVISTMMACGSRNGDGDVMAEEHAFLGALQTPLRVSTPQPDVMVLTAPDGRTLSFRRTPLTD